LSKEGYYGEKSTAGQLYSSDSKYIKETNGNSYTLAMIVKESDFIDPYPKYERLYHVWGVIGDFADVNFFYLYEDSDGWKVDKCGTGP